MNAWLAVKWENETFFISIICLRLWLDLPVYIRANLLRA